MLNKVHTQTLTFSTTTSSVLRMDSAHVLLAIRVPTSFADCSLTFESSMADPQTADASITDWAAVYTDSGSEYTVTVDADNAEPRVFILSVNVIGNFIRLISSVSQTLSVVACYRGIQ